MSKLTAIHKQIAALQAKAERITKQEMSAAISKVRSLMSEFGVTIEHLTQSRLGKPAAKTTKATKTAKAAKVKTASAAKYADPETGKTWSGFGRAPGWIADAKNRDDFLVGAITVTAKPATPKKKAAIKAPSTSTKRVKTKANASEAFKATAKKVATPKTAAKKKLATTATAVKKVVAKKPAAKKGVAKKSSTRKTSASASTPAPVESTSTAA